MIEHIRKYSGLIMITLVVSALAFILGDYNRSSHALAGGQAVMRIDGRTYNDKEFRNLGQGGYELAGALAQSGDYNLYQFIMGLTAGATSKEDVPEKFFVGRMIIRQAKEDFGVYPGDEEITTYLRTMRVFGGPDEKFNSEAYNNFIENYMGRLGMTEKDLRELVSDILAAKKINEIVGAGLIADRAAAAKNLAFQSQRITGETAKLDLTPYEVKIDPSKDEIKKYWENIRDAFTTEPKRKFTYIIVSSELPKEEAEKDVTPETIVDATASDEVKKAAEKKKDDERAKKAAAAAEARRAKQFEIGTDVDDFLDKLADQNGSGFEELAKANNWEVKTSEFFPLTKSPKDLDLKLLDSRGGKVIDKLFKIQETSDPFSKISEAMLVDENQWVVARLDGEEKSRPKTYEEARSDARAQYISEKAAEALKAAANEAVTKIKTLMTAGKSFAEAAKEAGVTETKPFTSITSAYRPDGATEPQNLFEATRNAEPGTLTDVIIEPDRAFIVYVAKREVTKDEIAPAKVDAEIKQRTTENEMVAYMSWIAGRTEAAKVERLYRR